MEDNKNRNYDQEDRDYKDAPMTTDFEKSKLNNDPNQAHQENPEQFEEFSSDQPNIPTNNGTVANSGNIQDDTWNNEVDRDRDIDGNYNDPYPISEPDYENNGNPKPETDDESDIEEEDLNEESDFEDDDDDIENEYVDLDDVDGDDVESEDVDDADEMHREISELRF